MGKRIGRPKARKLVNQDKDNLISKGEKEEKNQEIQKQSVTTS